MPGETNLKMLLGGMDPKLAESHYGFATLPRGARLPAGLDPVMLFREAEGLTVVAEAAALERAGIEFTFRCRMITLHIHSSLDAVGFLAAITARLAAAGMGVNPVSAFFHDHLFVPAERAEEALRMLRQLAAENAR